MRKNNFTDGLPPACLPLVIKPASQAGALTGNRTDVLVHRTKLRHDSHRPGNAALFTGATAMLRIWYKIQLILTRFPVLEIYVVKSIAEFCQYLWALFSLQYHILNMT